MTDTAALAPRPQNDANAVVAANVRAELAYSGLSQASLAQVLGFSDMALSRRLHSRNDFTSSEIATIADYFGIEPGDLFKRRRPTLETRKALTANGEGLKLPGLDSNQEPIGFQPAGTLVPFPAPADAPSATPRTTRTPAPIVRLSAARGVRVARGIC